MTIMMKKTLLILVLLVSFLGSLVANIGVSTKTILLRSTRSEKILKRPRSLVSIPVEATYDQSLVSLYFTTSLKEVTICISNEFTGEVVYENSIYVDGPITLSVNMSEFEDGLYNLQMECEEDVYCGTFNNENL